MKNYTLFLLLLLIIGCKTTTSESQYTFIGENLKSSNYEMVTLVPDKYELKNMLGYSLTRGMFSPELEKKTWDMPLIYFNKKNRIFYIIYDRDNSKVHYMKYNFLSNKKDTIQHKYSIQVYNTIFEENYKRSTDLVDFKFPEAEKYFKIKIELKDTLSDKDSRWALEKYSNNEIKRKEVEKLLTYTYKACFINLQMPKEEIRFKYNLSPNGKILFFGNEELYKKGYLGIYIYKSSNVVSHSGGLYLIRPKEKNEKK